MWNDITELWFMMPLWGQVLTVVLTVLMLAGIHLGAWCQVQTLKIIFGPRCCGLDCHDCPYGKGRS